MNDHTIDELIPALNSISGSILSTEVDTNDLELMIRNVGYDLVEAVHGLTDAVDKQNKILNFYLPIIAGGSVVPEVGNYENKMAHLGDAGKRIRKSGDEQI